MATTRFRRFFLIHWTGGVVATRTGPIWSRTSRGWTRKWIQRKSRPRGTFRRSTSSKATLCRHRGLGFRLLRLSKALDKVHLRISLGLPSPAILSETGWARRGQRPRWVQSLLRICVRGLALGGTGHPCCRAWRFFWKVGSKLSPSEDILIIISLIC